MDLWSPGYTCPRHQHLPPAEASSLLIRAKGKTRTKKRFPIEYDEFGVPDPAKTIEKVADTIDPEYRFLPLTNIHHYSWPRYKYSRSEMESEYRSSPTLMMRMPIQLHNYLHAVTFRPQVPEIAIMQERVMEDRRAHDLYAIGRRAVRFAKHADKLPLGTHDMAEFQERKQLAKHFDMLCRDDTSLFYEYLDSTPEGVFGILPDLDLLANEPLALAVGRLGRVAAIEALAYTPHHSSERAVAA